MKKISLMNLLAVLIMLSMLTGCAAAPIVFQRAVAIADLATTLLSDEDSSKSNNNSNQDQKQSDLILGKQQERIAIGNYEVRISDGYSKGTACRFFVAYDDKDQVVKAIGIYKKTPEHVKIINDFDQIMSENEKKIFIRGQFLKADNFDLDPTMATTVESPKPEKKSNVSDDSDTEKLSAGFAPH